MSEPAPPPKRRLARFCRWLLAVAAVVYLLYAAVCTIFQRGFIYVPPVFSPEQAEQAGRAHGLTRWHGANGQPAGWKGLSPEQPATGQVLVLHGNAGTAIGCAHYADVIQQAAPFDVYLLEYPGYADRSGSPSEVALDEAAEQAFQLLTTNTPIYLVGESLGSGVATFLAGRHPGRAAGIALLGAYNRLSAVGQERMPLLPVRLLLRDGFPSEEYLRSYHGPVAMVLAGGDKVVPEKFGRRLYDSYNGPKKLWEFPDGNHGTVMSQPVAVWKEIIAFWQEH